MIKQPSEAYNKQSQIIKSYTANQDLSSLSSDSSISSPKQTKIQKLNETRYYPNCGSVKKKGYYYRQKCVKNKKCECGYLTLIKKLYL